MKQESCECSSMDSLSFAGLENGFQAMRISGERHFERQMGTRSVFSRAGRIGLAASFGERAGDWSRAAIAVPMPAGICIPLLTFEGQLPTVDAEVVNFTLDANVVMSFDGERFQNLWNGQFRLEGSLNDVANFRIVPRRIAEPVVGRFKNYDWECFKNCAPKCMFCAHSIECWAICAGGCFAWCLF